MNGEESAMSENSEEPSDNMEDDDGVGINSVEPCEGCVCCLTEATSSQTVANSTEADYYYQGDNESDISENSEGPIDYIEDGDGVGVNSVEPYRIRQNLQKYFRASRSFLHLPIKLALIEDHNDRFSRGEESYSMMINQFGDLTDEEFKEMMKMERPESVETLVEFDGEGDIPDSVDWRKVGAVTDVKNQELSNKGPIAATLDLSGLKFYHNGVLDSKHCNSTEDDLNHAILLVGYEKNYYIAKNSWGQDWALGGYFNILRDNNTCGISLFNSFPIL